MPNWNAKRRQAKLKHFFISFCIFSFIFFILTFLFLYFGQVKKTDISFTENIKNNKDFQINISKSVTSFLEKQNILQKNFLFLNKDKLEKYLQDNFDDISKISLRRNINTSLSILIYTNKPTFFSCNSDFAVECVLGNSDGVYYKELENKADVDSRVLEIDTDIKNFQGEKNTDTFIGNRLLTESKFKLLFEIKKYFDQSDFKISKINIDQLEVASFFVPSYFAASENFNIRISLNKSFVETVKDFETLEKSVEFGNILKNKNSNLQYLDLSFKDKVFYK